MPVTVPEELAAQTAEGNTVLFVGAGMSRPRLPGWRDLLGQVRERLASFENLYQAAMEARRSKRYKDAAARFHHDLAAGCYVFPLAAGLRSIRTPFWGRFHFRRR
jgi:TolA-binding protein